MRRSPPACWLCAAALVSCTAASLSPARAGSLDRDTILTDAPGVPASGTVRVSAGGNSVAQAPSDNSGVFGNVMWAPFKSFAGDVGIYLQGEDNGPTARLRYQLLSQEAVGVDLALGVRVKKIGFFKSAGSPNGEVEFFAATGRSFGRFDVVLNGVYGMETGGPGMDFEVKAFSGYRFTDAIRAGLDGRVQAEFMDAIGARVPPLTETDIRVGLTGSFLLLGDKLQLQGLAGVVKPKGSRDASLGGLFSASFDF